MKAKKANIGVVIFLVVIILLMLTSVLTYVFLKTKVISLNTAPSWGNQQPTALVVEDIKDDKLCNAPYMEFANTCCLDKNYNQVCDNDEKIEEEKEKVLDCTRPYIKKGNTCCLDEDRNRVCDKDDYYYNNRDRDRFSSSLDSPLDITDVDVDGDDLEIEIENEDDEDVTILKIEVDDCDDIEPNKIIKSDDDKTFDLDCDDFPKYIDSDVEVTYTVGNSTEEETSDGRIRERRDYNDNYYDYDHYDPYY
ncbi:hypothetical protein GOV12_06880 [Candidatus Pacearchaeota archaeon]|nr:hypothetical protein [Candidatus Pacearchaeota archaeon]